MSEGRIIFFLTKIKDKSRRSEYETWVREVDVPTVMGWSCVSNYRVVRLEGEVFAGTPVPDYDYIEIMEVSDIDDYKKSLEMSPPELFESFTSHIGPFDAVIGTVV